MAVAMAPMAQSTSGRRRAAARRGCARHRPAPRKNRLCQVGPTGTPVSDTTSTDLPLMSNTSVMCWASGLVWAMYLA